MNNTVLNQRLEHASKKFVKALNQIKLLKKRIAELIAVFSYCDPATGNTFNNNSNENNSNRSNNANYLDDYDENDDDDESTSSSINVNLYKESIRQQIENLQSIKSAYFLYAQKKADEITKLQCDLYGEEAVREAYETAPPSQLIPATDSSPENAQNEIAVNETNNELYQPESNPNENDENMESDEYNNNISDYWTPWDYNHANQLTSSNSSNQLQLVEYDFLTA